jgi:hypothetical protein
MTRKTARILHLLLLLAVAGVFADNAKGQGMNGLAPVPLASLSDHNLSIMGKVALSIRPSEWQHSESANFVYHYIHSFVATPVSVEAEFYYRVIAKELQRDTTQWEKKSQIFIFEDPADWAEFQRKAYLDPWTGGIHSNNDLFIIRNPAFKFKGHSLGHEVTHLVIYRFFGNGIPLWLNEGYAEFASLRAHASFMKARGYVAFIPGPKFSEADFIPLKTLTEILTYPKDDHQVEVFYSESEKLVRFLASEDSAKMVEFIDQMAKGNRFDSALWKAFGGRFPNVDMLQTEFKTKTLAGK